MSIKAPFNFVPLNDKVFYPDWADAISQDVPFQDGQSGTITLNIEAYSPIFVRDGSLADVTPKENVVHQFSQWKDPNAPKDEKLKYFIPGSSVKGMLRSVLEIMSFGKLGIYDDNRYAVRDLNNKEVYMNRIIRLDKNGNKPIRCGWLQKQSDNTYKIYDHGEPAKVSFADLDNMFGTHMNSFFQKGGGYQPTKGEENNDQKSAKFKYTKFEKIGAAKQIHNFDNKGKYGFEKVADGQGKKGIVVFTGQPGFRTPPMGRQKGKGKGSEFIFWATELGQYEIAPSMIKDFKFAYFDHDDKKQSADWKYWKGKLEGYQKIPIFFQLDPQTKNVAHFGLSYLYKLPYKYSVGEAVGNTQKDINPDALDLAECIFGSIEDDNKNGAMRKGRVHFGHAFAAVATLDSEKSDVLNSPKASYYPLYLRQQIRGAKIDVYKTFMDKGVEISGRKRYPIQNGTQRNPAPFVNNKQNTKVETQFVPLRAGAKFQCKIAYHNLRKAELGALLSAISFHNTSDCFHSIGMAKPLGYGKIKVEIAGLSQEEQKNYLIAFEQQMNAVQPNWAASPALTELVTMASPQQNRGNAQLSYMKLDMTNRVNDFTQAKNDKEALDFYSNLENVREKTIRPLTAEPAVQSNVAATIAGLKKQLKAKQDLLSAKKVNTSGATNKTATTSNINPILIEVNTPQTATFLQANATNPKKRYEMEAIVTKSDAPNFIDVYVKEGVAPQNIKLDSYKSALELGKVIVVSVSVNAKGQVVQASFSKLK